MINKISFYTHSNQLKKYFNDQNLILPNEIYIPLAEFLSSACKYAEEENKIKPSLMIGTHITDSQLEEIIQCKIITFTEDALEKTNLSKRLKSYLPFCSDNWRVFIDIYDKKVKYGIMKSFTGPYGLSMNEMISDEELEINYVLADVSSDFEITLEGAISSCIIDFRLYSPDKINENAQEEFCKDSIMDCLGHKVQAKTAKLKTLRKYSQHIHGCICLIIKSTHSLPDDILKDGTFLVDPIDSISLLEESFNNDNELSTSTFEKYLSYEDIFIRMLNIDGITIIDTKGRIRAFNVFVTPDVQKDTSLTGGARKRAAAYLQKQTNPDYIGVYFQSQDGMTSYERIHTNE